MAKFRNNLPQLRGDLFITDGGIETTLIFLDGQELPYFAAFHLFKTPEGEAALRKYFREYGALSKRLNLGLILESPTWRASAEWGAKLTYDATAIGDFNRRSISLLEAIRGEFESPEAPIVISGCVGPRGDGYIPTNAMSVREAEEYHLPQVSTFAETPADMVSAITMNYLEEAIGITQAAKQVQMPVVVSFTVETDGNLPTGQSLGDAIHAVDSATSGYPSYFMINCAHPSHFDKTIQGDEPWVARIRGLRANASKMSHAELNEAPELDSGDPSELGRAYADLKCHQLRHLNIMGGCCGTDARHIEKIAITCAQYF